MKVRFLKRETPRSSSASVFFVFRKVDVVQLKNTHSTGWRPWISDTYSPTELIFALILPSLFESILPILKSSHFLFCFGSLADIYLNECSGAGRPLAIKHNLKHLTHREASQTR
jgi:hypothetical protein